ncbi:transcription factor A, mitochondrial [Leptidea sinapis]|uniref:transcription factor A, mitochondrial n=1 Tax=Leptidea sinapis TaxID=189913 RepID=UPI002133D43C|nr:transcription factor A, mitochondrial [Leptidea sinapis]
MASFGHIYRLSNITIGSYKNIVNIRWPNSIQTYNYTKKSAEERLGIEKPKRPLTPFFKFMGQMRPALLAKNPSITSKEAIAWTSKHWQQLDSETKSQMLKEYEKDLEDYKKIKELYEASLTEQQKEDIKNLKEEMAAAKEKRKLKAEYKELGRPKKPMSSYIMYMTSRKDTSDAKDFKTYQEKVKADWLKLPESERVKFEKQALEQMIKYKKDLNAWELKMISIGRSDLVRQKPIQKKKAKAGKEE